MMRHHIGAWLASMALACIGGWAAPDAAAQEVLPFPPTPSASRAGRTVPESHHEWRVEPRRLAEGAPNILIIMLDDAGFAHPNTFGGEINTPTLSRIAGTGVTYNAFHTTAMCSPTRSALLTGRNHHFVGNGQIAELANDFDGYTGVIPRTSATMAEVLRHYGYATAAFGKWHNTPTTDVTAVGPFDRWPTGHGFDYFYGFIAGDTSQWEPRLFENTTPVEPPHGGGYHLSDDLADRAATWLRNWAATSEGRPFFMYWTPGAVHGPHHVASEWADRYRGRFDDGWDAYRDRVFARQRQMGWIPPSAALTPRHPTLQAWADVPETERAFQRRLMEVYAGFLEHVDTAAGRILDEIERLGVRDNTLVIYVFSDHGASAEGQRGTISELLAQNGIPTTTAQQLAVLQQLGGLGAIGGPLMDNMYHAGWAWAGSTPFQYTKLIASHLGGTRTPLAVSWPRRIRPDRTPRPQFHHVIDIVPTVYELVGITPPRVVDGFTQDPIHGVSMAYSLGDAGAEGRRVTQYFEIMGSRAIYHDGWIASAVGPRLPWVTELEGLASWTPDRDTWELYNLRDDYAQARNLAGANAARVLQMREWFSMEAARNRVYPVGAGLLVPLNPALARASTRTEWRFFGDTRRIGENVGPNLRSRSTLVTLDVEGGATAQGVVYALGGIAGGLTLYAEGGTLAYEYNMLGMQRTTVRASRKLPAGRARVEVETVMTADERGAPADVILRIDGAEVGRGRIPVTVPLIFTASETLDVGVDLGSPVSLAYAERAPFAFSGRVHEMRVVYPSR